jgi:hypothetical protein
LQDVAEIYFLAATFYEVLIGKTYVTDL